MEANLAKFASHYCPEIRNFYLLKRSSSRYFGSFIEILLRAGRVGATQPVMMNFENQFEFFRTLSADREATKVRSLWGRAS
jgi:hypothetical protein